MDSLTRPEFREKLRTLGFDVIGKGPDAMRRRISEEVTRYRAIIAKTRDRAGEMPVAFRHF